MAGTPCENLTSLGLPYTTITSSQNIAQGAFTPPSNPDGNVQSDPMLYKDLPAFCRVAATLKPSSDSDIKIEVWLPISNWNGKFEAVGNGGWAGTIPYPALATALAAGYAGTGTDTGHTGNTGDFALGHSEKLIDFGYRSEHEMTVKAKAIIEAFYGNGPRLSYWNGCSTGGRQGIREAQSYPEDFDGIIAGATTWNQMRLHAARIALNLIVNKNPHGIIPPSKYSMIHDAVLKACDARDGVKDGIIENPTKCSFDYAKLACKGVDGADCLTKEQVDSARAMTSPIRDPKTSKLLYDVHLSVGSELGWAGLGGLEPVGEAIGAMKNIVFKDPNWDYRTMNMSTDVDLASKADNGAMYSGDPNLKSFFDRGGKLLMYHGWSDPRVTPRSSFIYYNNVVKAVGKDRAANSIALFMVPGMNHCQGGIGTDTFNKVAVLEQWVEQGKKPTRIVAAHLTDGKVDRTRPLCPFGQVATYKGTGDTNDAMNFSCASAKAQR